MGDKPRLDDLDTRNSAWDEVLARQIGIVSKWPSELRKTRITVVVTRRNWAPSR